jgi:hypothetical protein
MFPNVRTDHGYRRRASAGSVLAMRAGLPTRGLKAFDDLKERWVSYPISPL